MRKDGYYKRILMGALTLSLAFTYLPISKICASVAKAEVGLELVTADPNSTVAPAGGGNTSTSTDYNAKVNLDGGTSVDLKEEVEEDRYSVVSNGDVPAYQEAASVSEWKNRKANKAPDNTYVLTVSTGAKAGNNVLYISIRYKDKDGKSRTQYVVPSVDALERSVDLLNHSDENNDIYDTYGSSVIKDLNYKEEIIDEKPLAAWTVQDFAFQADAEISTVESFEIYMEKGSWTACGLSLYKVNEYKGYEEYGMISGQRFLDFSGYLLADATRKSKSTISTSGNDSVFVIGEKGNTYFNFKQYKKDTMPKEYASDTSMYTFRMDFSDMNDGGIEAFINEAATRMNKDHGIVEDISLAIQYQDTHGWTRKVTLPIILNSYANLYKNNKKNTLFGLAQRGDSIAFQGFLPDFKSIYTAEICVGELGRAAVAANGITINTPTNKMNTNLSETNSDDIRLAGVSIYKGGCMAYFPTGTDSDGNTVEGATVEYVYESAEPLFYYTTTDRGGVKIKAGGQQSFDFKEYKSGSPIIPTDEEEGKFLITLNTSDRMTEAGTKDDVNMRFYYNTMDGSFRSTTQYSVLTAASDYMGKWPTKNDGNFIEESGLVKGGEISFLISAEDFYDFTGVDVSLNGTDEWVMSNLTIDYVESFKKRRAYIVPTELAGATTNYWFERDAISAEIFSLKSSETTVTDAEGNELDANGDRKGEKVPLTDENGDIVTDEEGNPIYVDSNFTDIELTSDQLIKGGKTYTINFGSDSTDNLREKDYSAVRYSMSWEQTQVDWGFFKKRKTYKIGVEVASDPDYDNGNGDSGSTNHFYFQLVFKNGNSAYVLANQQISSDGFRSGKTESFTISTNQDYGEVVGVRIIPEDISSDADPFDKLNIKKITVSEDTSGGTFLSYVIDKVGWIDIDYIEENEGAMPRGRAGRLESELAKYFKTAYKTRSVKVLCEVATGPNDAAYNQFVGSIMAEVSYISTSGAVATMDFDVAKQMYEYMDEEAKTVDVSEGAAADGLGSVTDPRWMIRANHIDRFVLPPIADLKSIKDITFTAQTRNNQLATWNIERVCLSQIISDGSLQLTTNDEYYRNMTTNRIAVSNNKETVSQVFPIGAPQTMPTIEFTDNTLVWTSDEWVTPVSREPDSTNDEINLYIYPSKSNQEKSDSKVNASLTYAIPYSQYMQASDRNLLFGKDSSGRSVYYSKGIKATEFISAGELKVQCKDAGEVFDYAIVQHVRDGVVIGTYSYYLMEASAVIVTSAKPLVTNTYVNPMEEKISLSFGPGTKERSLVKENNDIAVSFFYKSTLDDAEYQSPYVYLTDQGYTSVSKGLFADVKFNIPFVKKITGYSIAGYGKVSGNISGATAVVYNITQQEIDQTVGTVISTEAKTKNYATFNDMYALTEHISTHEVSSTEFYGENSIAPVELTFKTAGSTETSDGSSGSEVKMIFNYRDYMGTLRNVKFENINRYIQGDEKSFKAGEEQTIKVFLPEMSSSLDIISIDIIPYNSDVKIKNADAQVADSANASSTEETIVNTAGDGQGVDISDEKSAALTEKIVDSRSAYWTIESVTGNVGYGEKNISRTVNQTFNGLENGGVLRLSDVTMTTRVESGGTWYTVGQEDCEVAAKSGKTLHGTVLVKGGFTATAYRMVDTAETEITSDTIKVVNSSETFGNFEFKVPENTTGQIVKYKIKISPIDAPDMVDTIIVSVESKDVATPTPVPNQEVTSETTEATASPTSASE
ncbi:MAG: hypothetical protein K6F77_07225 [Lachnospiraceae bacterium]|nr:hypothetical protein [Lachnospiraceae bacterium]